MPPFKSNMVPFLTRIFPQLEFWQKIMKTSQFIRKMKELTIIKEEDIIQSMLEKFSMVDTSFYRNLVGVIFQLFG